MNKKNLTEADIRTKFITPAILGEGEKKWDVMTQILEEHYFTKGRVIVRGRTVKRGEAKKADYILFYKPNIPIAVVEAKDNNYTVGAGMQQALEYAEIPDIPFAYSSNGDAFLEHDRTATSGVIHFDFPLPKLLKRLFSSYSFLFIGCSLSADRTILTFMKVAQEVGGDSLPHHYAILASPADTDKKRTIDQRLADAHITPLWYPEGEHNHVEEILQLLLE